VLLKPKKSAIKGFFCGSECIPQEPLIPQNEVHANRPDEVIENGVEMNFVPEEEEKDSEEDP
jgi:hypothetical protein